MVIVHSFLYVYQRVITSEKILELHEQHLESGDGSFFACLSSWPSLNETPKSKRYESNAQDPMAK